LITDLRSFMSCNTVMCLSLISACIITLAHGCVSHLLALTTHLLRTTASNCLLEHRNHRLQNIKRCSQLAPPSPAIVTRTTDRLLYTQQ
jgi:hypothetical protein